MPRKSSGRPTSSDSDNVRLPKLIRASGETVIEITSLFLADKSNRSIKTQKHYQRALENFCRWCDRKGLTSIIQATPEDVIGWIESRRQQIAMAQMLIEARIIRYLFTRLRDAGLIAFNPLPGSGSLRLLLRSSPLGQDPVPAVIIASGNKAVQVYFSFVSDDEYTSQTQKNYRVALSTFFSWCESEGVISVLEVTPNLVMAWINFRRAKVTVSTLVAQAGYIRRLFTHLKNDKIIDLNPVPMISRLRLLLSRPAPEIDEFEDPST